jgi:putative transposase
VVDGCSRLAVGHQMGERATAELAIGAVQLAVWRRGLVDDGLIQHSDQGAQPRFKRSSQHVLVGVRVGGR